MYLDVSFLSFGRIKWQIEKQIEAQSAEMKVLTGLLKNWMEPKSDALILLTKVKS